MIHAFKDDGDGYYQCEVAEGEELPAWTKVLTPCPVVPVDSTPTVITVTPWQIRKALNQLNLRAPVESAVSASSQEVKDGWEFASEFRSDNELIAQLCTALGKTEAERVAIFQLAATL